MASNDGAIFLYKSAFGEGNIYDIIEQDVADAIDGADHLTEGGDHTLAELDITTSGGVNWTGSNIVLKKDGVVKMTISDTTATVDSLSLTSSDGITLPVLESLPINILDTGEVMNIQFNSIDRAIFSDTDLTMNVPIYMTSGATPGLSFSGNADTGFNQFTTNNVGVRCGGQDVMTFKKRLGGGVGAGEHDILNGIRIYPNGTNQRFVVRDLTTDVENILIVKPNGSDNRLTVSNSVVEALAPFNVKINGTTVAGYGENQSNFCNTFIITPNDIDTMATIADQLITFNCDDFQVKPNATNQRLRVRDTLVNIDCELRVDGATDGVDRLIVDEICTDIRNVLRIGNGTPLQNKILIADNASGDSSWFEPSFDIASLAFTNVSASITAGAAFVSGVGKSIGNSLEIIVRLTYTINASTSGTFEIDLDNCLPVLSQPTSASVCHGTISWLNDANSHLQSGSVIGIANVGDFFPQVSVGNSHTSAYAATATVHIVWLF